MIITEPLFCNGINATTGKYLKVPRSLDEIAQILLEVPKETDYLHKLQDRNWREAQSAFPLIDEADSKDLATTGWGIIFAQDIKPEIREALKPLLEHRCNAAAQIHSHYYREFFENEGYHLTQSTNQFLSTHGVELAGPADPETMPYYLLLVGDPNQIPFRFQYELDVEYAVGRIWFSSTEEYENYAQAVVRAENNQIKPNRRVTFFGVRNPDDRATALSTDYLVNPLSNQIAQAFPDCLVTTVIGEAATKTQLSQIIHAEETPALLFTASHGLAFEDSDLRKPTCQGALLCQDWEGPKAWSTALLEDFYFSSNDIGKVSPLSGGIVFHFACFSAGTPNNNDFMDWGRLPSTARAQLASLPLKMLGHPQGGPLAVIGHLERAWVCSFLDESLQRSQLTVFRETLKRLLNGYPIGYALERFNLQHARWAANLANELYEVRQGRQPDRKLSAYLWMANHDSRNYLLLGDPAVHLI